MILYLTLFKCKNTFQKMKSLTYYKCWYRTSAALQTNPFLIYRKKTFIDLKESDLVLLAIDRALHWMWKKYHTIASVKYDVDIIGFTEINLLSHSYCCWKKNMKTKSEHGCMDVCMWVCVWVSISTNTNEMSKRRAYKTYNHLCRIQKLRLMWFNRINVWHSLCNLATTNSHHIFKERKNKYCQRMK